ncbi:MAG: Flp pilus assembly complex ATPase component TadA [Cryomorphaceae bacterium]|nr:Flp pilus assembly complex ATPase component TadA [Cryomorphaceae bacterium]
MLKISRDSEINLINILIDQDIISGADLGKIKQASQDGNKSQIDAIFELELTDENKILDLLVKEQNLEIIDLSTHLVSDEIRAVLPSNYINMNFIAPFKIEGDILHIAIPDSSKLSLMRNLKTITKKNIELHAATVSQISNFIDLILSEGGEVTTKSISDANKIIEKTKEFDSEFADAGEVLDNNPEEDVEAIENESEVIKFSTAVVAEAIKSGVSDIHIEPYRFSSRVRYRLDGILTEQTKFNKFLHSNYGAVVTRFKIMGKLDIAERRIPQDGAIPFKIDGKIVDLRLSMLPTANNERIVMRVLNKDAGDISLEQLNFEENDLKNLRHAIHGTQGLVLVTGPTGSGKTTTLYSILKEISKPNINILTAEDPVEFELDGVGQVQIKEDIGFTFSTALRSFLRQDPEIILIGEMRDKETVDIGLKAALTGHLVFSTLHTNDAPSTITRLQNMGTPDYLISAAVSLILAQRLARKNCPDCRIPDDDVTPKALADIGFTSEQASRARASKGKGCPKCKDTGYKGRTGIYEILTVTKPLKEAILKKATTPELKEIAIKEGFRTMQDMGRQMLISGDLNFREYDRVLQSD